MTGIFKRLLLAGAVLLASVSGMPTPVAPVQLAWICSQLGACSGLTCNTSMPGCPVIITVLPYDDECDVNIGRCEPSGGDCLVNIGYCGGSCAVSIGFCNSDELIAF